MPSVQSVSAGDYAARKRVDKNRSLDIYDILEDPNHAPELARDYKENKVLQPKFRKAVETLYKEEGVTTRADAIRAMTKLKNSILEGKLNIFFSYKAKQCQTANTIVEALRSGTSKLNVAIAENILAGKEWRQFIKEKTASANWLILLLTDPDEDWDWCLFECGRFEASMVPGDRLICLHPQDKPPPEQLSHLQSLAVNPKNVRKFLRTLYMEENSVPGLPPLNDGADIDSIGETIVEVFRKYQSGGKPDLKPEDRSIELEVADTEAFVDPEKPTPEQIDELELERTQFADREATNNALRRNALKIDEYNIDILKKAKIRSCESKTPAIFGWGKKPETLAELAENVAPDGSDRRWLSQLGVVLKKAGSGKTFAPVQATFTGDAGKVYRPHLHATQWIGTDENKKKVDCFHILFVEDVASIPATTIKHERYAAMADLVKVAYRFRWEVLEPSQQEKDLDLEKAKMIIVALERIEKEGKDMGYSRPDQVVEALGSFGKPGDADRIKQMFETWWELRSPDPKQPGPLDEAIRDVDPPRLQKILKDLRSLNKEFLTISTAAFARMSEELPE